MPQKRNYDLFEIMRGNSRIVLGHYQSVANISVLSSGYQRDMQLTKEPYLISCNIVLSTIKLLTDCIPKIIVNEENLSNAMTEDLFATEKVYELVKQGVPFRDAYQQIKDDLNLYENN